MKPSYKKSDPNQQYKRDLTTLVRMGFDVEKARKGLELKDGDINEAVAYLLSGGVADPTKPITNHVGKAAAPTGLVANESVDRKPSSLSEGKGRGQVSQSSGVPWSAPNERSYYPGSVRKPTISTVSNRWRQDSGDNHPTVRAHWDPSKMYPGTVCVAGSAEPSRDEESQMATTLRDESGMTVTAEAELVQEEPDQAQLVGRIQRLEEQLQAERNQCVVADELMTDTGTSRSEGPRENRNYKRWVIALVVCAVIALGVAVALSLVLSSGGNDNGGDESDSFVSTPAPSPTSPPTDWGEETTMVPTSEETAVPTSEESAVPTEFSMAI